MDEQEFLLAGERLDDLIPGELKIIQSDKLPRFSLDAVLLADFVRDKQASKTADLGSGTGVISLLLAAFHPGSHIDALEMMSEMCDMAERSVKLNHLEDRIRIVNGDILDSDIILGRTSFDLVVANPPYLKKGQGRISPDPLKAAYQCEIYCTLADIIKKGGELLKTGCSLALIQRTERLSETKKLMSSLDVTAKRLRLIKSFPWREPQLFLVEGEKGYRGECHKTPPLIIFNSPGVYTDELKKLFCGYNDKGEWDER